MGNTLSCSCDHSDMAHGPRRKPPAEPEVITIDTSSDEDETWDWSSDSSEEVEIIRIVKVSRKDNFRGNASNKHGNANASASAKDTPAKYSGSINRSRASTTRFQTGTTTRFQTGTFIIKKSSVNGRKPTGNIPAPRASTSSTINHKSDQD